MYSVLGLETGALLHVALTAAGLAALLAASELAFAVLRYAGAAYLVLLGVRALLARGGEDDEHPGTVESVSRLRLVRDGVLVDLLNPKTALFFIAFLPQFVDPARGSAVSQLVVLGLCFVALAAVCDSAYALVAAGLTARLRGSRRARRRVDVASGGVYLCLAGAVLTV